MKTLSEMNERGGTLLLGQDSNNVVGILPNGPNRWTIVTYFESNYPALLVREVEGTEDEIREVVYQSYGGMTIRKDNLNLKQDEYGDVWDAENGDTDTEE
jgi:hypothetical protein